jgi:hypothetical protein
MKVNRRFPAALLVFAVSLAVATKTARADVPPSEPQLVRVSYVEGDVRFNCGNSKRPDLQKPWELASVNLPVEQGYALSTGAGRAEVEFESGSMVYLAPNSVLLFKEVSSTDGWFQTDVELVTGTLTTNVAANPEEHFVVELPTGKIEVDYPESSYIRVDSYLDGMAITAQSDTGSSVIPNGNSKLQLKKGQTLVFEGSELARIDGAGQSPGSSDWDGWVAAQVAKRNAATQAGLKASGLPSPIPGLADLYTSGTFSPCPPYGMCWEPKAQAALQTAASPLDAPAGAIAAASSQSSPLAQRAALSQAPPATTTSTGATPPFEPRKVPNLIQLSSCPDPNWIETEVTAKTQKEYDDLLELNRERLRDQSSWTVCHYGSWIRRGHRYVAVIRHKKHHHPIRWVREGKQVGFVPLHPNDRKDTAPLNLKHGIFIPSPKDGGIERVAFNPKAKIETLDRTPKEFRAAAHPETPAVTPPEITARRMEGPLRNPKTSEPVGAQSKIVYDYDSKKFVEQGVTVDGRAEKPVVVAEMNFSGKIGAPSRVSKTVLGGYSSQAKNEGGKSSSGSVSSGGDGGSAGKSGNRSSGNTSARSSAGGSGGGGYSGGGGRSSGGGYSGGGESRGGGSGGGGGSSGGGGGGGSSGGTRK